MSSRLYLDDPNLGQLEKDYLAMAIDSGYVSTAGPFVAGFEKKLADFLNIKGAVSTQSGTAALHIALHELGIGPGDEVIAPALTFVATVNPISYVGATPVFVDVDIHSWTIDPAEVEKNISEKTKAIILVHLYGNPCHMDSLMEIASKYNLFIIEDATESLGAKFGNRFTGTFGNFGCFSFNGNKTITTGGGGMITGLDARRLDHIKFLVNQARESSGEYYHPEIGFNYRMTNIEAAIGLAQMERIKGLLAVKKEINRLYRARLSGIRGLTFQEEAAGAESSNWLTCCTFDSWKLDLLSKRLLEKGVPTRRIFMPISEFPPYASARKGKLDNTYSIYERGLCLPSSTLNSSDDIGRTCDLIQEAIA